MKEERCATAGFCRSMHLTMWLLVLALGVPGNAFAQASQKNPNPKSDISSPAASPVDMGKELFQEHCASCHYAETTVQKIGPGLKALYARGAFSDGKKVNDNSLSKWIETGGKNMPGFKETMKPQQIRDLISYIKTI